MATLTKPKTWADNENVLYTDLNSSFDTIYNEFNGNIDNANIKSSAGIVESKLAFSTSSGHDHDGVNSKAIPKGFVFTVTGTLSVSTDPAPWLVITQTLTITKAYANVKTAPTAASLIVDIEKSTDNGGTWTSIWNTTPANRLTITTTNKAGTQTSFDTTSLAEGNLIRVAVDQVGSTVAGADLTVIIKT